MKFYHPTFRIITACLFLFATVTAQTYAQESEFNSLFKSFLQEYQRGNNIDYKAISPTELAAIDESLSRSAGIGFIEYALPTQINIYNYLVIRQVIDNYPIASVEEVVGFFKKDLSVGPNIVQLDQLEKAILARAGDPYVHLLLNCGAKGCPSIKYLDPSVSLDSHYPEALGQSQVLEIDDTSIQLSQIFFWYKDEFGSETTIIEKLSQFLENKKLKELPVTYSDYSWMLNDANSNGELYYPTKLYGKGGYELKIFNNYYSQNDSGTRYNFFSSFFQILIGSSRKVNYGFDVKLRSVNQGQIPLLSALKFENSTFEESNNGLIFARSGISGVGPRIKYQPFEKRPNINFLHAIYFVPLSDAEGNDEYGYADYNNLQLFNQMFFEKEYSVKRRLFVDLSLIIENIKLGVHRNETHFMPIQIPVTAIYSYFPNSKTTVYGLGSFGQRLDVKYAPDTDTRADYTVYGQAGIGFKYFLTDFLEAELLYTNFLDTTPGRSAHTFNLGLRFFKF